ncbi:MAG TPA: hypothetical protein VFQ58_06405 [Flavisolibacter sp.]|jgi:hypothetical protein|nr:hypothetical protein [Flavisolibacter sp.]
MQRKKPELDIINEVLEGCILAYPVSSFIISLYKHYLKYGSLSKKQMEGLLSKAEKAGTVTPSKLATLEAMIKKMPTRFKSDAPLPGPVYQKEEINGKLIDAILQKYPQHKRVIYLKSKYENNTPLTAQEVTDLKRFYQLLIKN